jgi:hypothetical protein
MSAEIVPFPCARYSVNYDGPAPGPTGRLIDAIHVEETRLRNLLECEAAPRAMDAPACLMGSITRWLGVWRRSLGRC